MKRLSSEHLVEKSIAAMTAAIEIYNKPNFEYKEESFAILAVNAWELLLKARILQKNNEDLKSIEKSRRIAETEEAKEESDENGSTIPTQTIGISEAIKIIRAFTDKNLPKPFFANLYGLLHIRHNSVHLVNMGSNLSGRIHEIGLATIKNFARILERWFQRDILPDSSLYIPLAFNWSKSVDVLINNEDENKLINILDSLKSKSEADSSTEYVYAGRIEISFEKSHSGEGLRVRNSNSSDALVIQHKEGDMLDLYRWDYRELTEILVLRYSDFKEDKKYHEIRKKLAENPYYCYRRYLNPKKMTGRPKNYYRPDILMEFDEFYSKII